MHVCMYACMCVCIYIYIYIHTRDARAQVQQGASTAVGGEGASVRSSLRASALHVRVLLSSRQPTFQTSQHINDISAAHVVCYFVSSEIILRPPYEY